MNSGTARVEGIDPNAVGYAVQKTVSTKINQTWLASQTGPIDSCAPSRIRSACGPRPAKSCQKPAPKSAPANTVYSASPARTKMSGSDWSMSGRLEEFVSRRVGGKIKRSPRQPPEDPGQTAGDDHIA